MQPWSTLERKWWHLLSDPEINWKNNWLKNFLAYNEMLWGTVVHPHRGFHLLGLIRPHHSTVWVCTGCLIVIFLTILCSLIFSLDHVVGWHYQRSCTQLQLEQRSNKLLLKTPLWLSRILIFMMSCFRLGLLQLLFSVQIIKILNIIIVFLFHMIVLVVDPFNNRQLNLSLQEKHR